jgi:hypothetical protein
MIGGLGDCCRLTIEDFQDSRRPDQPLRADVNQRRLGDWVIVGLTDLDLGILGIGDLDLGISAPIGGLLPIDD